jgi:hypothetical protein
MRRASSPSAVMPGCGGRLTTVPVPWCGLRGGGPNVQGGVGCQIAINGRVLFGLVLIRPVLIRPVLIRQVSRRRWAAGTRTVVSILCMHTRIHNDQSGIAGARNRAPRVDWMSLNGQAIRRRSGGQPERSATVRRDGDDRTRTRSAERPASMVGAIRPGHLDTEAPWWSRAPGSEGAGLVATAPRGALDTDGAAVVGWPHTRARVAGSHDAVRRADARATDPDPRAAAA